MVLTVTDSDVLPGMDPGEQAQRWLQRLPPKPPPPPQSGGKPPHSKVHLSAEESTCVCEILLATRLEHFAVGDDHAVEIPGEDAL
jgi:hypothetical protein